ncbi:NAD-dependent epimerase/dehydratase family protein [Ectothiorhodospira haloalkaliphila]|uniref:NAD-dependent epimerase/dehydratase family protein n=1 Tax=Ectothiorhodospira haloalkaliphila TaxID=421628 RepID=UPI001EE7FCE1|nr:NAD-dependent epimerase/dehydratase family protein [Ectothiorhodospira haloalkaliphila]MCG5526036.1 NAD-dependent epimerase/dehydratase family protein [Ectothiorhodospira haloalkaliphila]
MDMSDHCNHSIAVTGATGWIGAALVAALAEHGRPVRPLARSGMSVAGVPVTLIEDIGPQTRWEAVLRGVDTVVHAAARVHVPVSRNAEGEARAAFDRVNADGSARLAAEAARLGVRRLVYLSSVKVHGESTPRDAPARADPAPSLPMPDDPYGRSKWRAERALADVATRTGLEVVVIRPPLVYGPGVGANFQRLVRWVERGRPLPLARVDNRRSLVALDNLVDLILRCIDHPAAPGGTFLVSDGEDVSTPELVRRIARAAGVPARLWPVPVGMLSGAARLFGRADQAARLLENLQVDISATRERLGWHPVVSMATALEATVSPRGRMDRP